MRADAEGGLILVADDDRDDQEFLQAAFVEAGIDVALAFVKDGCEVLDWLRKGVIGETSLPRLLLMDLNMPRLDGRSTLQRIRADPDFGTMPVVILTTSKSPADIEACYRGGCNSYCVKPHAFDGLVELVAKLHDYWFSTSRLPRGAMITPA